MTMLLRFSGFLTLSVFFHQLPILAQATTNSSTLTNQAAPSASSVTTGGTNINYQTNNAYNNENGFGPGIFCRTPTLYVGGNWGQSAQNNYDSVQNSGNTGATYSANAGILFPFGSSVLRDCARLTESIARDREISSQLSMIRTCASLENERITVDPEKFPLLAICVKKEKPKNIAETKQVESEEILKKLEKKNYRKQPEPTKGSKT